MDLLSQYESVSENEKNSLDPSEVEKSSSDDERLKENQLRRVYLITYSQADLTVVPTRLVFADLVLEAVTATRETPLQWVCAQERHRSGQKEGRSGVHFHMALKFDKVKR